MTINSVFGASLAASVLMSPLVLPVAQQEEKPRISAPVAVQARDEAANIVFDRLGRKVGRSLAVRPSESGELLAVTEQGEKPVAMVRGPDGLLRLVAE